MLFKPTDPLPSHSNHKCSACGLDADHVHTHNATLFITCFCGLARLLPDKLVWGEKFVLPPCPACGSAFFGRYFGDSVDYEV